MELPNTIHRFQSLISSSLFLSTTAVLVFLIFSWRLWVFTIKPTCYPAEPKEVPYWIPILGHAVSFFRDSHGTLTRSRQYFSDTREPFGLTIAGTKLYIITSAQDAAQAYKNTTSLTFDDYIRQTMVVFGGSLEAVDKMWRTPGIDSPTSINPNPGHKMLAHMCEDFYRQQLHPGRNLTDLQKVFLHGIEASMSWEQMPQSIVSSSSEGIRRVSMLGWCRQVLLESATKSFFGDRLLEIEPQLLDSYSDFDDNSWQLTYQLPWFLCMRMRAAKQVGIDALTKYFALPRDQRTGATWLVRSLESEMRNAGIADRDIAAFVFMVYWVINGNAYKICFWILAYALHDNHLLGILCKEVQPAVSSTGVDIDYLLQKCPKLEACYHEALRITSSSSSVRTVIQPTTLGSKVLSPGHTVLIPCRQLHFDTKVFGEQVGSFDADRFIKQKLLHKSQSFKPFGGGTTYCPGRFLAQREVYVFVAAFLGRFDVSLVDTSKPASKPRFPRIDEKKPCLGIMGPAEGQDCEIFVKKARMRAGD